MRRLLCLLSLVPGLLMARPGLTQVDGSSSQVIDSRYAEIEDGFIEVCMNQPMPPSLAGVRITNSVRTNYCGCWFDYVQSNFTFEEYIAFSTAYVDGKLASYNPQVLTKIASGVQGCYDYAIRADGRVEEDKVLLGTLSLEDIERLEQQALDLRNQGEFAEAISVAENAITEKKS